MSTAFWNGAAAVLIVETVALIIAKAWISAKRWYRRQKVDARIIRQAKAAGVWNTNAGGRALELYAKECGVQKFAGESDAHLRARIKEATESGGTGRGK